MIKITRHLKIHFFTILLFIICLATGEAKRFLVCYLIMAIHELAHLGAALCIGLMPSEIVICPFGLNLRLKNKMVYSLADEIILYSAGPLSNAIMALFAIPFLKSPIAMDFYYQNMALFLLNLLPVVPTDGGVILKKIIAGRIGYMRASKIMRVVSGFTIVALACFGGYLFVVNRFNYSICFLIIFVLCNLFVGEEKYNVDFLRELMFYKEKGKNFANQRIKSVIMREGEDFKQIAKEFSCSCYYLVFLVDKNDKILQVFTESEIMRRIAEKG